MILIHSGVFPKEMGAIIGQLESLRNIGDYSRDKKVTREQAGKAIEDAEKFNAAIRKHIQEQQQKNA